MTAMNGRSLFTLAVAVVIGLGAMKLSHGRCLSANRGKKDEETQEVLVAARDFKEEETLKPDMVKVISMAKSAVPPNAFSSFKEVEDRWVKTTHAGRRRAGREETGAQGNAAGPGRQHSQGDAGLRHRRHRAVGRLGVHPARAITSTWSGTIPPRRTRSAAETILQNVLVLAAGQVFTRPEERAVQSRTVTLALSSPAEVDILVAARARGLCRSRCAASTTTTSSRGRRPSPRSTPNTRSGSSSRRKNG